MSFAMPGVLSSRAQFAKLYDAKGDPLARRRLAARVRPFLMRRTKSQVAKDLPDRVEEDLFCEIGRRAETALPGRTQARPAATCSGSRPKSSSTSSGSTS
jgi:SNF2 family DNA or RNA helicase